MLFHGLIILFTLTGPPDLSQGDQSNPPLTTIYQEIVNPRGFIKIHRTNRKIYKELE